MKFDLQFSDIPHNWAICYLQDCPLASTCLRHRAATLAPDTLRHHDCVLPAARSEESCALFVADQPARIAYGMTDILPSPSPSAPRSTTVETITLIPMGAARLRISAFPFDENYKIKRIKIDEEKIP